MKNRAKCKLCQDVLESFHQFDYVSCKCGEISISGGEYAYEVSAKNFENFLRLDDNGNEIQVKVKSEESIIPTEIGSKPNREELLNMLDSMIKNIENLPPHAMQTAVNHYDLVSSLLLISALFRSKAS